jgi:hypothetical protein
MRKKKALCIFIVILVFSLTCSFAFANNYFNACRATSLANNGAEALIPCQDVYVPNITNDLSCAWAMTASNTSQYTYAQVGWSKNWTESQPYLFWEWSNSTTQWGTKDFSPATIGQYYDFKVGCDSTNMYFIVDNVTYKTVPLSSIPWTRNKIEFAGETTDVNCQCPGRVTNKILFSNLKYKDTSNVWQNGPVLTKYVSGSNMGNDFQPYWSSFCIWDTRYN